MAYAAACKAVYPSSILGVASRILDPTSHPLSSVDGVHVLICNRSSSKGRFTASVLRQFPDVEVVGSFQSDDDIRGALLSVPILLTISALLDHIGRPNLVGFLFGEALFEPARLAGMDEDGQAETDQTG